MCHNWTVSGSQGGGGAASQTHGSSLNQFCLPWKATGKREWPLLCTDTCNIDWTRGQCEKGAAPDSASCPVHMAGEGSAWWLLFSGGHGLEEKCPRGNCCLVGVCKQIALATAMLLCGGQVGTAHTAAVWKGREVWKHFGSCILCQPKELSHLNVPRGIIHHSLLSS